MFSEKHKKEMPLLGMSGMGGGVASNLVGGAAGPISATGGTKTTSGDYTVHTFTSSGSLVVASGSGNVEYLVIGGGGGGGGYRSGVSYGWGGGAGGYRTNKPGETPGGPSPSPESPFPVSAGTYEVVIGSGGAGRSGPNPGYAGGHSRFDTITSQGGGGGGGAGGDGAPGGSGGGDAGLGNRGDGTDQSNIVVVPPQGYPGGPTSGSGGGAGGAGTNGQNQSGGAGLSSNITGSSVTRAVGGNGSTSGPQPNPAPSASANTGSGGTGGGHDGAPGDYTGGTGGSGIVIVRYLTS